MTRMLYFAPDMAGFAADKELAAPPGERFSYSSGTSVIVSRIWQDVFDAPADAAALAPRRRCSGPLGHDQRDHGGRRQRDLRRLPPYLYATARDWARFGLLLARDGRWLGRRILPEGFVAWLCGSLRRLPVANTATANVWLRGPGSAGDNVGLPEDTFWIASDMTARRRRSFRRSTW